MKNSIQVTIVIPTFNSASTLDMVLKSVFAQTIPQKALEVLVIDAGSSDETLHIAKRFKVTILHNPKQHQVYAKHTGHLKARGKYIVHLDSDEVLGNPRSLENKLEAFASNTQIKASVPSGHKTPHGVSAVNRIINEFGDPFSYYMYGFSFNWKFFINQLKRTYITIAENKKYVVIDFNKARQLPGIEMSASGMMLDREYLNKSFPSIKKHPRLISQVFYFLVERGDYVAFTKNDPIVHYSASSWPKYLRKVKARVLNNIFKTEMGKSAFSGRSQYYNQFFEIKKYLFIPYSLMLVFPLIEGVRLSVTRRHIVFMTFPFLCIYICFLTVYYMSMKMVGLKPINKGYGF